MEKVQVWIDLNDKRYAKRLVEFLKLRYGDNMEVEQVDDEQHKPDMEGLLLTDRERYKEGYGKVIWVSVDEGLNPYQSGHKIAREILKRTESWHLNEEVLRFSGKSGEWISVYSTVGGVGNSTLAMGLADVLARNKRVLFLALEGPSAWPLFYQYPLQYNLSDFFYCFLMGNREEWEKQLNEMVYKQKNGVFFLAPCPFPDDLLEMRDSEIIGWMDLLKEKFDYVVADLSSQMIRPLRVILQNSNKKCFLMDNKAEARAKWQGFQLLDENIRDHWVFIRHAEKCRQGEICLPEENVIFEVRDGIKQFIPGSSYYACIQEAVEEWV